MQEQSMQEHSLQPDTLQEHSWRMFLPPPWRNPRPVVAVLRFSGPVGAATPLRQGLSLAGAAEAIERAFSLKRLRAVAIAVNSPGGSPVQSTLIHDRIRQLSVEKDVPVVTFCEDVAASGGYLVALAGDEIYADASSIVGSIGVVAAGFGFDQAIAKLGIDRRVYTAGTRKVILDPFQPEKPDDVEKLKALQEEIHETFKTIVRERRGRHIEGREGDIFNGEFWTGKRAAELGLIDGLGDMRTVMRERYGERVKLVPVPLTRAWRWQRSHGVGHARPGFSGGGAALGAGTIAAGLADEMVCALEERALWQRYGL